ISQHFIMSRQSIDDMGAYCKDHLEDSLTTASKLTALDRSPCGELLNRMNAVLGTSVVTNFGAATLHRLRMLHEIIEVRQAEIIDKCENLALLYLTRSFAVVMEEAVRQKEERSTVTEADEGANRQRSRDEYNDEGARRRDYGLTPSSDDGGLECFRSSSPSPVVTPGPPYKRWRPEPMKPSNLDHTPDAVKGLVTVYGVHSSVAKPRLHEHLRQVGPVVELNLYPQWGGGPRSFAVCRYESDEVALEACRRLHLTWLGASRLCVNRARFHYKRPPETREDATKADGGTVSACSSGRRCDELG
ncbi:hypothetical protein PFISCL1PPCAC_21325, partial [Pristionchus fissidentatus]